MFLPHTLSIFVFAALAFRPAEAAALPNNTASQVISIRSPDHFYDQIGANNFTFVKFFHPKCPHCQKLQKPFEQLSHPIRKYNHNKSIEADARISLAQVDASNRITEPLLRKHSPTGFPTLKLYRNSLLVAEYNGVRTTSHMFDFLLKSISLQDTPLFSHIHSESVLRQFLHAMSERPVILSVYPPPSSFVETASDMHTSTAPTVAFATVDNPALLIPNRTNNHVKRLLRRHGRLPLLAAASSASSFTVDAQYWFPDIRDGESLASFMHTVIRPEHEPIQLSHLTAPYVLHAERPMLLAFGQGDAPTWDVIYFLAHADAEPPKMLPVYMPVAKFREFAHYVGLNVSQLEDHDAFVEDWETQYVVYRAGNMEPIVSRYDPSMNVSGATWLYQQRQRVNRTFVDTYAGELMRFTHQQLKAMLSFDGRGVLLLTYTRHCRLCTKYESLMTKVAKVLKSHAGFVVVARVHVDKGFPFIAEVKDLEKIKNAPSIVWLSAGERVVVYDGAMSVQAVARFGREMAAVPAEFHRGIEWMNVTAAYGLVIGLGLIVTAQLLLRGKRRRFAKRQHVT
ncbi:Protein disulfide-isomerase [Gracilariopsis chorda]|uniref:Protein disulfide-isomerase n=1 Tax=Gracilariopsis chorda TaxID=448386 RepID=A0A2V3IMP6_9FLOR|nr:Protein disulfide-isomerase [Gracilariopsis chorda]|eukprot:PXF43343.1 Protein disulfide-isomerase [Gracilariopsis chorda]